MTVKIIILIFWTYLIIPQNNLLYCYIRLNETNTYIRDNHFIFSKTDKSFMFTLTSRIV